MKPTTSLLLGFFILIVAVSLASGHSIKVRAAVEIGDRCKNSEDCKNIENAECQGATDMTCQCKTGFDPDTDNKVCTAIGIGDKCKNSDDCKNIENAECQGATDMTCQCKTGFDPDTDNKKCTANAKVGDDCSDGVGCDGLANGECSATTGSGKCQCTTGFHETKDKLCAKDSKLHEDCTNTEDCVVANSECKKDVSSKVQKCLCKDGYVDSNDKNRCLQRAILGAACEEDGQCTQYATCQSKICKCDSSHEQDVNSGMCIGKLHSPCKEDKYCKYFLTEVCRKINGTTDDRMDCQCKDNYAEAQNGTKCLAPNQGACYKEEGCQDLNAECISPSKGNTTTACLCKSNYELKDGKCSAGSVVTVALGALLLSVITRLAL